jgi:hypothetical protein
MQDVRKARVAAEEAVWVSLADSFAENIAEYGHVLPKDAPNFPLQWREFGA